MPRPHSPDCLLWAKNLKDDFGAVKVRLASLEKHVDERHQRAEAIERNLASQATVASIEETFSGEVARLDYQLRSAESAATKSLDNHAALRRLVQDLQEKYNCISETVEGHDGLVLVLSKEGVTAMSLIKSVFGRLSKLEDSESMPEQISDQLSQTKLQITAITTRIGNLERAVRSGYAHADDSQHDSELEIIARAGNLEEDVGLLRREIQAHQKQMKNVTDDNTTMRKQIAFVMQSLRGGAKVRKALEATLADLQWRIEQVEDNLERSPSEDEALDGDEDGKSDLESRAAVLKAACEEAQTPSQRDDGHLARPEHIVLARQCQDVSVALEDLSSRLQRIEEASTAQARQEEPSKIESRHALDLQALQAAVNALESRQECIIRMIDALRNQQREAGNQLDLAQTESLAQSTTISLSGAGPGPANLVEAPQYSPFTPVTTQQSTTLHLIPDREENVAKVSFPENNPQLGGHILPLSQREESQDAQMRHDLSRSKATAIDMVSTPINQATEATPFRRRTAPRSNKRSAPPLETVRNTRSKTRKMSIEQSCGEKFENDRVLILSISPVALRNLGSVKKRVKEIDEAS